MIKIIIPERQSIYETLDASAKPLRLPKLLVHFALEDEDQKSAFSRRLAAMERDGEIRRDHGGAYATRCRPTFMDGRIERAGGDLILRRDDDGAKVALPARLARRLFAGDRVRLRVIAAAACAAKPVAVEVLERRHELVGLFSRRGRCVVPLRECGLGSIPVTSADGLQPSDGAAVIVRLQPPQPPATRLTGTLVEVLGHRDGGAIEDGAVEIEMAIRTFDLAHAWPREALQESEAIRRKPSPLDDAGREDLRALPFVTIDGSDSKDFDDAVCCEEAAGATTLWVAIADVASYVAAGGALDREAAARGNSVYFPGRVVPMLPPLLADDLCSLRARAERAALVCRMRVSPAGELLEYDFCRAVIRSQARLTYGEVGAFFARGAALPAACPASVRKMLRRAHGVYRALRAARARRDALDFETCEARVHVDKHGRLKDVVPLVRSDAHRLIEEFMICANVAAAAFLKRHKRRFLYRVHQGLKDGAAADLACFLRDFGIPLRSSALADVARVLQRAAGHEQRRVITGVVLRSLARAVYTPLNTGHFGLALEAYAHFTSPIRRYPDLLVHRALHDVLGSPAGASCDDRALKRQGEHCTFTEKRADDASRDVESYFKCVFLEKRVGETFTGVVTGVTSFGLFIELENLYVEGLLHVRLLDDDYYRHDAARHRLVGERGGEYRLGDALEVVLMRVAPREREIDLAPPGENARRKFFHRLNRRRGPRPG